MGQVTVIKSSRKQWTCRKCQKVINPGDSYLRGEVNFGPVFIRCTDCGLKPYEVTTSYYIRSIGRLLDTWETEFGIDEFGVNAIKDELESIQEDQQAKLDNMPEQLQESSSGLILQDRIDGLTQAIDDLDIVDIDEVKSDAMDEVVQDYSAEYPELVDQDVSYDDAVKSDKYSESFKSDLVSAFEERLSDEIQSALDEIDW